MLETETLGPLKTVNPSESIHHIEQWQLVQMPDLEPDSKDIIEKLETAVSKK